MDNRNRTPIIYASEHLKLDSDVMNGGGTDQTKEMQALLDRAKEWGGLYLVMDGALLVSHLTIHSNTTIFCLNRKCGFFQKAATNNALLENENLSFDTIGAENIVLEGGTYNFNGPNQERQDCPLEEMFNNGMLYSANVNFNKEETFNNFKHINMGFKFCGVKNLTLRNIRTVDQRIYAMFFACFEHVLIENVAVDLPNGMDAQNQDGLHFQGPGRDLVIRNIRGCSGDDFLALTPDEFDFESSITDVLIDGVYLENADQGVRLLSRHNGRLDRVHIRNVYGTYKSFGFFITPWYGVGEGEGKGNYGSLTFENICLSHTYHKYHYTTPFLFRIGGKIENLTLRNIQYRQSNDTRPLVEIGQYFRQEKDTSYAEVQQLVIDGLQVVNTEGTEQKTDYIVVDAEVDQAIVRNVQVINTRGADDTLLKLTPKGHIGDLQLSDVMARGVRILGGDTDNIDNIRDKS